MDHNKAGNGQLWRGAAVCGSI